MEYKSNSYRGNAISSRETEPEPKETDKRPKVEKVINGEVQTRKKTGLRKLAGMVIQEDVASMKRYLIEDIVIPKAKEIVSEGIDRILYGEGASRRKRPSSSRITPYRSYWERPDDRERQRTRSAASSVYDIDDIVLDNRGEAERVLDTLYDIADQYEIVSVADLYNALGVSPTYVDRNYGWTKDSIQTASIVRTRDGYWLKLSRPLPLD